MDLDWPAILDYVGVIAIAGLVAVGELVARYRDDPYRALLTRPAGVYTAVNAVAASCALGIVRAFNWRLGVPIQESARLTQVLAAGFGSMTLFRSSLFHVRAGDQDVGIGPVALLQVILSAADRAVDRRRAAERSKSIGETMKNVSFDRARLALTTFCFTLMQNVDEKDQAAVREQVDKLAAADFDGQKKSLIWGLYLLNIVGEDALHAAVAAMGQSIAAVGSVQVAKAAGTIGDKIQLHADVRDRSGVALHDRRIVWTSENPTVVTVDASGVATAVAEGEATITAWAEDEVGTTIVTIQSLQPKPSTAIPPVFQPPPPEQPLSS